MSSLKQKITTKDAPDALPHIFSQAIVANGFVYCSGSIAMHPETLKIVDGDVAAHTHQCISNLSAVLKAAGSSLEHVVKVNVFLASMDDFQAMNSSYESYFGEVKPSRTCVAVKTLPFQTDVEIECVAVLPPATGKL
ncbi:hypothetical protein B0A48_01849 [Cryoendolithus antarcticus]|uniref:2-iminobutanoate/2-iminopropanoate deaminase n=1 Tax=Cryoendolithus antarcticus TaxID=1507870 RepID=A0A1V8TQG6_9PEZI|nr:hypothetical protein B0A48_01849 [Cryoendolithus antarcticus]OQO19964.1 hypothetical protein B0A51_15713 [Rachicladosporium sp. CCFEE 5018]